MDESLTNHPNPYAWSIREHYPAIKKLYDTRQMSPLRYSDSGTEVRIG
jgi:hypothetical protein